MIPLAQALTDIQQYAWLISIILSLCTLVVWVFYAYLLHRDARHQRLPALFIHQANGHGPRSVCLLSNLGREIVHVLGVIVVLETDDQKYYKRLASRQPIELNEYGHARVQDLIKQGPLPSGYFLALGTFGDVIEFPEVEADDDDDLPDPGPELSDVRSLEIRVAAIHAAYDQPIGALRRFRVDGSGPRPRIVPAMPLTKVLQTPRERRRVTQWLEDWMARPALRGTQPVP